MIIESLNVGVAADEYGYFYIPNIPAGTHKIKVSYVGFEPYFTNINIQPGSSIEAIFDISEGVIVLGIEVSGIVSGRRKALQQQKASMGVANIISADQMERFPDQNIGDALKRIPGINVQYDQGEARFGQIRGTSPDMSSVTLNGNRTPSAEGSTRAAQLDLIPAEMIQTVEVNKVVTADMDGDAIGGSVNLVTKSAPSKSLLNSSIAMGYNPISGKMTFNGSLQAGKRFFNNKFGAMLAVSYNNNPGGSDNIEAKWKQNKNTGEAYISEFQIRQYFVHRERQSYSLSLDYQFNANNRIEAKGMLNIRNDWENRFRLTYRDISAPDADGNVTSYLRRQTKGGGSNIKDARLERQNTQSYNIKGEHHISRLTIDWNLDYATASENRPNERYIGYESDKKNPFRFKADYSNGLKPIFTPLNPSQMELNSTNFKKRQEFTESFKVISEQELKGTLNFTLNLAKGEFANNLKLGYKIQSKDKKNNIEFYDIEPLASEFNNVTMNNIVNQTRSNFMAGPYSAGEFVSKSYLGGLDLDNGALFSRTRNELKEVGQYKGREVINAGFLRFDQKLGSKVDMVVGVRIENTLLDYSGFNFDVDKDDNVVITPTSSKRNINNVLPSLLVKYTPAENVVLRGSYTNTIARPKFSQLVPGDLANISDDALTQGNPNLTNTLAHNFDLMAEYYLPNAGILSAGVFYKNINNFIVDAHLVDVEVNGRMWSDYYRPVNAGNAYLFGVEAALQTDLAFITPALKNFGVYVNYTFNLSQVTQLTDPLFAHRDPSELPLPGTPKHILNASLYYENKFLSAALSYNFASAFLDNEEMGLTAFEDRYYNKVNYLDFNVSVKATKWLTVFGELNNILTQPLRHYQGQ